MKDKTELLFNRLSDNDLTICKLITGYVECENYHHCERCVIADRYRLNKLEIDYPLFNHCDALPQSKKGCSVFLDMPLILKPEAMDRVGIERKLIYQIAIPSSLSSGLFPENPCGPIDCRLFVDSLRTFTVYRHEVFGVPNRKAVEKYDGIFLLALSKMFRR